MNLSDHYNSFMEATEINDKPAYHKALSNARHYLCNCNDNDWAWLESSLNDPKKKWFVAAIFASESLPKRLLGSMVRAAVYEPDASRNKYFIVPCLRTYGLAAIETLVNQYFNSKEPSEIEGAKRIQYWLREPRTKRGMF